MGSNKVRMPEGDRLFTGRTIGKTSFGEVFRKDGDWFYNAKCECGTPMFIRQCSAVKNAGRGCVKCSNKNNRKKTHGLSGTKIFGIWGLMISRCTNVKDKNHKYYGGRGISVCQQWVDSPNVFTEWAVVNGYKEGLTLDRIDNNGNYEPSNCRWATRKEQANNTRRNVILTHNGESKTMSQWSRENNLPDGVILKRIQRGWPTQKAIESPSGTRLFPTRVSKQG